MALDPRDVFEILVRENAAMLSTYLRSLVRDPGSADDLFQETFLVAWRNLHRYDKERPFAPWLRGIAGRLVLAHRRKGARGVRLVDDETLEELELRMSQLDRIGADRFDDKLDGLRECIERLPEAYREAIGLRYKSELPAPEVCTRLGISAENLKKRLQRARARLQECLEKKLAGAEA